MTDNAPHPGDTVVPSARAERRRMREDIGIYTYLVLVALVYAMVLSIVVLAR